MGLPVEGPDRAVAYPHFPTTFHAVVYRNWGLVPAAVLATTLRSTPGFVHTVAAALGLPHATADHDLRGRAYLSIIRRNWHLLPLHQITSLLGWSDDRLAHTLDEDDFLFIKLGSHKPACAEVGEVERTEHVRAHEERIRAAVTSELDHLAAVPGEPLFAFVDDFARGLSADGPLPSGGLSPLMCYGYFCDYASADGGYDDGYVHSLRACGIDSIWQPGLLRELAPFPWDPSLSEGWQERLDRLRQTVARLKAAGMRLYLYLNEPRALPSDFFDRFAHLKGAVEGDVAALCTSLPEVQDYLTEAVAQLCASVPDLGGIITITFSENLTNCWSHQYPSIQAGTEAETADCARCLGVGVPAVVAGVNNAIAAGIRQAETPAELIVWDWSWPERHAVEIIDRTDPSASLLSVSEWGCQINRGGVVSTVDEYAMSASGPSATARRHWQAARARGMRILAKIQVNNSWELSAVPYIPITASVSRHVAGLLDEGVSGIMASWTLGGYPSPSMDLLAQAAAAVREGTRFDPRAALLEVARGRFGSNAAPDVIAAWTVAAEAFEQYPFSQTTVYTSPVNYGPANPLWSEPTGRRATMLGFPYDDVETWRGPYPAQVLAAQFERVASGLAEAHHLLHSVSAADEQHRQALATECRFLEVGAIHLASVANQIRFATLRADPVAASAILVAERELARRLLRLQWVDSRIGYEASNHYYYTALDLIEKIFNCDDIRRRSVDPAVTCRSV